MVLGHVLNCFLFGHFNDLKAGLVEPTLLQLELIQECEASLIYDYPKFSNSNLLVKCLNWLLVLYIFT